MHAAVIVVALLGPVLASCALVTFGSSDYKTTCSFSGSDTGCGKCIAQHCQPEVDACCADSSCRAKPDDTIGIGTLYGDPGVLAKLDTCGGGGSCKDLENDPKAPAIRACIEDKCQGVCDLWRSSTLHADETNCTVTNPVSGTPDCSCAVPGTVQDAPSSPNSTECAAATVSRGLCCADKDWPAPAAKCSCRTVTCHLYSNACTCELDIGLSDQPVDECSRGSCCIATDGTCSCWEDRGCYDDEQKVDKCTADLVYCSSQRNVDRCSAN